MNAKIFTLFLCFILFSCKKEIQNTEIQWNKISERVQYQNDNIFFKLKAGKFEYHISHSKLPFKKVILLNSSLLGYFTELNLEDKIIGVSSPEYIYSEKILNLIKNNKIANVGNEQKYDIEKILMLKPDAIFTNYISSFENTYDLLKKNGIEIIFLDEYLEQKPLEKTKYLLIFGELFGNKNKALQTYNKIENQYRFFKKSASQNKKKPIILANEMYGNQWFIPGGKTQLSHFISDANAEYILKNNTEEKAIPMSFEEVFSLSKNATIWVNAGNHKSKKELLNINPNYAKLKVFNDGKIYSLNAKERNRSNDFFESGNVRSDLVLKDYIKIFYSHMFSDYELTYMREIK